MKNLRFLLLIFLAGCSSNSKPMGPVAIIEQSAKMIQKFNSNKVNGRKDFEVFEENQYKGAVQAVIERYKNKKPCRGCLKAYFTSLKYYTASAAEFHVEQISYFFNNYTDEAIDLCKGLNRIDRYAIQSRLKTAYQMNQIFIRKERLHLCALLK